MADDLKPMLTKVLASGGEKKFYFVYGVGKRKDGKGDGELAVGGKKPKKTEIEGELAACKEVHEGVCWVGKGPDSNGTVYFQGKGKKISSMIVAKMALTAKRTTGLQYDFQVPSSEEEARADKLADGEGNEGKAETAPENLELAYQARVKALTDDLKKALTSGTAAGNEAKLRFSESQLFSRKKDFAQAMALLKVVEEQIKLALAGTGADPAAKAAPAADPAAEWKKKLAEWSPAIKAAMAAKGPNAAAIAKLLAQATALSKPGGDMAQALAKLTECHALATGAAPNQVKDSAPTTAPRGDGDEARWTGRRQAVNAVYLEVLKKQPPNATLLRSLLAFADGKAEAKDFGKALAGLEKLENLLQARNGKADAEAGAKAPPGANGDEARWTTRRQAIETLYLKALKEQPENASQLRAVLAFADGKAEVKDFGKALLGLDKLETLMQAAAGTTNGADPAAEWKKKYADWIPAIKAAMAAKGPNAAAIAKLLAQATALSKPGGDMAQALAKLTECHALAASATVDGEKQKAETATNTTGETDSERKYKEQIWKLNVDEIGPKIKAAIAAKGPNAAALAKLFAEATALSKPGGDMLQMLAKLKECRILLNGGTPAAAATVPAEAETASADQPAGAEKEPEESEPQVAAEAEKEGQTPTATESAETAPSPESEDQPDEKSKSPTARWEAVREKVIPKLQEVIKEVVATKDPEAGESEMELKVVMRQLKAEMKTKQHAMEMEHYLKDDDVVATVCELAFDLKTPLLKVLSEIKDQLAA